jgi:hypothetical protein
MTVLSSRVTGRFSVVAVLTALLFAVSTTAAYADYQLNGNVTYRAYRGSSGISLVYKSYSYSVDGSAQVCVRSSSQSGNDPNDPNNLSRIYIVSSSGTTTGGYASIAVGNKVKMNVNTNASPAQCAGYKLAYQVWVYL